MVSGVGRVIGSGFAWIYSGRASIFRRSVFARFFATVIQSLWIDLLYFVTHVWYWARCSWVRSVLNGYLGWLRYGRRWSYGRCSLFHTVFGSSSIIFNYVGHLSAICYLSSYIAPCPEVQINWARFCFFSVSSLRLVRLGKTRFIIRIVSMVDLCIISKEVCDVGLIPMLHAPNLGFNFFSWFQYLRFWGLFFWLSPVVGRISSQVWAALVVGFPLPVVRIYRAWI